jgi:hypothetical protein
MRIKPVLCNRENWKRGPTHNRSHFRRLRIEEKFFPFNPSLIAVGIPPTFVARDGTPNELASAKTTPKTFVAETKFIL